MAPFRSSRSNRHLQHENVPRARAGIGGPIDHDPTEGLPVKKWQLTDVTIKQVEKDDDGEEAKTGNVNPDYPWPELPLPKDFYQLPPHSQEILRRARIGNTRVRPAIYNPATGTYTAAPAINPTALKSKHLANTTIPAVASAVNTPPAEVDMLDDDPEADITAQPKPTLEEDRTFTVRRWVPIPQAEADKKPEPKYLADRRPGLKNIYGYGQAVDATIGNGNGATAEPTLGAVANAAGEEISSTGLELSSVGRISMGTSASAPIAEPPRRRGPPPPPKRKKKGGVGRRKKVPVDQKAGEGQGQNIAGGDGTVDGASANNGLGGLKAEDAEYAYAGAKDGDEDDGSGSDDGEEGSEEGEIDEGDVTMNTDLATEAKDPKEQAVEPVVAIAEVAKDVNMLDPDHTEVTTISVAEVGYVETTMPPSALTSEEAIEETVYPITSEPIRLLEKDTLSTAGVVYEGSAFQEAIAAAPTDEHPHSAEGEIDLLGSLDRAVEGMQGANADAMDTVGERRAE